MKTGFTLYGYDKQKFYITINRPPDSLEKTQKVHADQNALLHHAGVHRESIAIQFRGNISQADPTFQSSLWALALP